MGRWVLGAIVGAGVSAAGAAAAPPSQATGSADGTTPPSAARDATQGPSAGAGRFVVLELFTSQGCSSCPPADGVLSRIGSDERIGARVVPLAFHVDYWDRVGWTDPFGKQQWSARQEAYNRVFRLESVYTPQIVVNGRAQLNGSHEERILREIAADLDRQPDALIDLQTQVDESGARAALSVVVTAEIVRDVRARKLEAFVAIFENGLVTPVGRGENGGRTLRNDFVVRRLEKALSIQPKAGARGQRALKVTLDRAWKLENLGVAAFLQDPGSMTITAAVARPLR